MLNLNYSEYCAIKAILDAEHQRWKDKQDSMKSWGKRETRKERIKRRRKEQQKRTDNIKSRKGLLPRNNERPTIL